MERSDEPRRIPSRSLVWDVIAAVFSEREILLCNQTNFKGSSPVDSQVSFQCCPSEVTRLGATGCTLMMGRSPAHLGKKVTHHNRTAEY